MRAPRHRVSEVIAKDLLKAGQVSKKFSRQVAAYLLSDNRVRELDSILRDIQLTWADNGYVEAVVTSAHPLNAKNKVQIKSLIKQLYPSSKQIVISEVHDSSILGGARLSVADKQLDISLKDKLVRFQRASKGVS